MNRQTRERTSTEALASCPRIKESRPVMGRRRAGSKLRGGQIRSERCVGT